MVREDVAHNINWQVGAWLLVERISCLELSFCLHVGSDFPVRSSQPISKTKHHCCGQSETSQP